MRTRGGRLGRSASRRRAAPARAGERVRAHFRSDAARLAAPAMAARPTPDDLVLDGIVAQSVYVGQGYRYRVRTGDADIWVHAPERVAEGSRARVVVPRDALMLFRSQAHSAMSAMTP